jgi:hypothetical protein
VGCIFTVDSIDFDIQSGDMKEKSSRAEKTF